jgi:hypothetical protein
MMSTWFWHKTGYDSIASWHLVPSELGNKCKMPSLSAFIALKDGRDHRVNTNAPMI